MKMKRLSLSLLSVAVVVLLSGACFWYFYPSHRVIVTASDMTPIRILTPEQQSTVAGNEAADKSEMSTPTMHDGTASPASASETTSMAKIITSQNPVAETSGADMPTTTVASFGVTDAFVNVGFSVGTRDRMVDTIIVHSSYNAIGGDPYDVKKIMAEYREAGVAPHYLVARNGTAYRLVRENDIAYHAGVSTMKDGRTNVNDFSIGIEMIGTQDSGYTDAQYAALNALIKDIKTRHVIKFVVGHSDIAPGRKTDPWRLDWARVNR